MLVSGKKFEFFLLAGSIFLSANCEEIQTPAPTTPAVKVENVVDKVLNDPLAAHNVQSTTIKAATDLTSAFAAFMGFCVAQEYAARMGAANPQAQQMISVIVALGCLRLSRSALQIACKYINWDPRDLAIANALIATLQQGNLVTSDYESIKQLLDTVAPAQINGTTKSAIIMSNEEKIRLSQIVRSYIFAGKNQQKFVSRSKKIKSA